MFNTMEVILVVLVIIAAGFPIFLFSKNKVNREISTKLMMLFRKKGIDPKVFYPTNEIKDALNIKKLIANVSYIEKQDNRQSMYFIAEENKIKFLCVAHRTGDKISFAKKELGLDNITDEKIESTYQYLSKQ